MDPIFVGWSRPWQELRYRTYRLARRIICALWGHPLFRIPRYGGQECDCGKYYQEEK